MQSVQGAKQRDDHNRTEDKIAMRAKNTLCGQPQRKIVPGHFVHRQNIEHRGIDQQIDQNDREKTGKNGAGHEVTGIFNLIAEINHTIPPVIRVDSGLNTEQQCSNQRGSSGNNRGRNSRAAAAASEAYRMPLPNVKQAMTMIKKTSPLSTVVKF